jgi:hypothetical protein
MPRRYQGYVNYCMPEPCAMGFLPKCLFIAQMLCSWWDQKSLHSEHTVALPQLPMSLSMAWYSCRVLRSNNDDGFQQKCSWEMPYQWRLWVSVLAHSLFLFFSIIFWKFHILHCNHEYPHAQTLSAFKLFSTGIKLEILLDRLCIII